MSLIYSLVARQNPPSAEITNLCSFDTAHGNYPTICQQILKQVPITQNKIFKYNNEYNFHILKDGTVLYICMAGSGVKNKTVFAFLQEIRKKFREKYSPEDIAAAKDYDMSASFSDVYKNTINFYNSSQFKDNKDVLMKQLNNLQEVMSENIEKVLQNQEKVELVVKKATRLRTIADEIKENTSKMKKQAWLKRNKFKILIFLIIVAAAVVAYVLFRNKTTTTTP